MNKQTTVRAVARKTGHTYFEVQTMLEALLEVWADALVNGEQISIQDFLSIKVTQMKTHRRGKLLHHRENTPMPKVAYRVDARMSNVLKQQLRKENLQSGSSKSGVKKND
ncbi:MAG: hypothetical protein DPW16_19705 [Chloroflexi bacterium]|nr:hypothetical protein [Chloroflexota bacterium]